MSWYCSYHFAGSGWAFSRFAIGILGVPDLLFGADFAFLGVDGPASSLTSPLTSFNGSSRSVNTSSSDSGSSLAGSTLARFLGDSLPL